MVCALIFLWAGTHSPPSKLPLPRRIAAEQVGGFYGRYRQAAINMGKDLPLPPGLPFEQGLDAFFYYAQHHQLLLPLKVPLGSVQQLRAGRTMDKALGFEGRRAVYVAVFPEKALPGLGCDKVVDHTRCIKGCQALLKGVFEGMKLKHLPGWHRIMN